MPAWKSTLPASIMSTPAATRGVRRHSARPVTALSQPPVTFTWKLSRSVRGQSARSLPSSRVLDDPAELGPLWIRTRPHAREHELQMAAPVVGHDPERVRRHDASEGAVQGANVVDSEILANLARLLGTIDQRLRGLDQLGDGGLRLRHGLGRHREDHALLRCVPGSDIGLFTEEIRERLPGPGILLELGPCAHRVVAQLDAQELADELVLGREVAIQGADAETGSPRDLVHLSIGTELCEDVACGGHDALPVAARVCAHACSAAWADGLTRRHSEILTLGVDKRNHHSVFYTEQEFRFRLFNPRIRRST